MPDNSELGKFLSIFNALNRRKEAGKQRITYSVRKKSNKIYILPATYLTSKYLASVGPAGK